MIGKDVATGGLVAQHAVVPGKVTTRWDTGCARCDAVATYLGTRFWFVVKAALKDDGWEERHDGWVCPDCAGGKGR